MLAERTMNKDVDFASLMESVASDSSKRAARRVRRGEVVEGTIVEIGSESIFVDVGTPNEARIDRAELMDAEGNLRAKVGDSLRATVVDARPEALVLAITIGRDGGLDVGSLRVARESGSPVQGTVKQVVKGGLEVDLGGVQAFCPASQIERGFTQELEPYVGQTFDFRVVEIRDGGRSVVVSRRAELEAQREASQRSLLEQLSSGKVLDGTVHAYGKHGLIIDLGGLEGFVHISEIAHRRVERVEDMAQLGDTVRVQVLSIEDTPKGPRVRLSMKALAEPPRQPEPRQDEVLEARVAKHANNGLVVTTARGEGFVPLRELGLPPGADHRRVYPVDKELKVVLVHRDPSGKLRFSATGVARVEEQRNFRDFAASAGGAGYSSGLASLGDVFRGKLRVSGAGAGVAPGEPGQGATPASPERGVEAQGQREPRGKMRPGKTGTPNPGGRRQNAQALGVVRREKKE